MIRFVLRKSWPRIRKAKSDNSKEILERIERYLSESAEEPVNILTGFWGDQQKAITYKEIRQIVLAGVVTIEQVEQWRQDYSVLVNNSLRTMWENAVTAGAHSQPILDERHFEFNMVSPGVDKWITERGAQFVTMATTEQQQAISALLLRGVEHNSSVDEVARNIRACIGLTKQQSIATANLYDHMKETLRNEHPRMWDSTIEAKARHGAQMYAERVHRQRAMTIARTEIAHAYNQGADLSVRQAYIENLVGAYKKVWSTSGDDRVCQHCAALDGQEVGMDGKFDFGRGLFDNGVELPPAHPNCACAIEYIEIEPPRFEQAIYEADVIYEDESVTIQDVTQEYDRVNQRESGTITYEPSFESEKRSDEVNGAKWIQENFGGNILLKAESKEDGVLSPDYEWEGKLWDLKSVSSSAYGTIDKRIRHGLKQIEDNPGGLLIDFSSSSLDLVSARQMAEDIMIKRTKKLLDIIVKKNAAYSVLRCKNRH